VNGAIPLEARLAGKRALIFDFDGTIADSSALHARAFGEVLGAEGLALDYARIAGRSTREAVVLAFALAGRAFDAALAARLVEAKQARARALIAQELGLLPGVRGFLDWARPRFALAICSSASHASLALALERLSLEGWFRPVVSADDVANAKPDPEGFLKTLALLGCPAAETLVFEDSAAGLAAAAGAGMDAVDVRPPFRFPEWSP
jgi:sugar-phosphatase